MRVGFYYVGDIPEYRYLGGVAAAVCKNTMPEAEIVHLTDKHTKAIDGVDSVIRMERDCPMAVFRMRHHQADGDWLFIDVDVLVLKDVSDVFNDSFDIAIASRVPGDGADGPAFSEMPHNMGVVFSRSPEFWKAAEKELLTYDDKAQHWMGDQLAVCRLIKRGKFDVKVVPGEKYNFPPRSEQTPTASIVHYKGRRKPWMLSRAKHILQKDY